MRVLYAQRTGPQGRIIRADIDAAIEAIGAKGGQKPAAAAAAPEGHGKPVKVSLNDFIIKAVAIALRQHPEANSSLNGDSILRHRRVHRHDQDPPEAGILAVGAASPVPVLRNGELIELPKMTMTVDHRALDGATAAAFLRDL